MSTTNLDSDVTTTTSPQRERSMAVPMTRTMIVFDYELRESDMIVAKHWTTTFSGSIDS